METAAKTKITVETTVNAPVEKVWEYWINPVHVTKWNSPSPEWHTPKAENDVRVGGKFSFRMESVDGKMGFDFGGVYDKVEKHAVIEYTLGDDRKVKVDFSSSGNSTKVVETFEAEDIHSLEMQKAGWQAIIDNFKNYVERN